LARLSNSPCTTRRVAERDTGDHGHIQFVRRKSIRERQLDPIHRNRCATNRNANPDTKPDTNTGTGTDTNTNTITNTNTQRNRDTDSHRDADTNRFVRVRGQVRQQHWSAGQQCVPHR